MKILVADDAEILRQRMVKLLSDIPDIAGVFEAEDCQTTRDAIRQHAPNVVVLDLNMPDGTGLDVLSELSRAPVKPLVIVLTSMSDDEVRQRCIDAGAEYFFDKSSGFLDAVDTVRMLVTGNDK